MHLGKIAKQRKISKKRLGGDPNRFSTQKEQKYVDYRKRFKYSVSKEADGAYLRRGKPSDAAKLAESQRTNQLMAK